MLPVVAVDMIGFFFFFGSSGISRVLQSWVNGASRHPAHKFTGKRKRAKLTQMLIACPAGEPPGASRG